MENRTLRKLVTTRSEEILLVEHRRAHNICIELAGIRLPFPAIKVRRSIRCRFSAILHPTALKSQPGGRIGQVIASHACMTACSKCLKFCVNCHLAEAFSN
jgi:hypothetical protein